jgi:hypothetical protein
MPFMKLLRDHTHAGTPYTVGARLHVDAATADWLAALGVAELAEHPTLKSAAPAVGEPAAAPARKHKPTSPRTADTDTTGDDHGQR